MTQTKTNRKHVSRAQKTQLPIVVTRDEDGFYVVSCPVLPGCYTQGKTLDEALKNIHEVVELLLEDDKESREFLRDYRPQEVSFHTITV